MHFCKTFKKLSIFNHLLFSKSSICKFLTSSIKGNAPPFSNIFSLKNPFIKNYKEDGNFILMKTFGETSAKSLLKLYKVPDSYFKSEEGQEEWEKAENVNDTQG